MRPLLRANVAAAALLGATLGAGLMASRPARAQAQPLELELPRARQGYYHALGIYLYDSQQWDHGRPDGVTPGRLLTFRLGQTLTRRWGLGLRIEVGAGDGSGRTSATSGLGLEAEFNPFHNLALRAGLGLGTASVTVPKDLENPTRSGYGSVYILSASWDLFFTRRVTGGWSLAPTVLVRYLPSDIESGLWVCAGIQISHWSGRPHKELVLPDRDAYK